MSNINPTSQITTSKPLKVWWVYESLDLEGDDLLETFYTEQEAKAYIKQRSPYMYNPIIVNVSDLLGI